MLKSIIRLYNYWLDTFEEVNREVPLFNWYPLPWTVYLNPEWFEIKDTDKE